MKAITNGLVNGKYKFETYTSITEDLKEIKQLPYPVTEIVTCKDKHGNDTIFCNTNHKKIIMYRLNDGEHSYNPTFIDFDCTNMIVYTEPQCENRFAICGVEGYKRILKIQELETGEFSRPYILIHECFKYQDDGTPMGPMLYRMKGLEDNYLMVASGYNYGYAYGTMYYETNTTRDEIKLELIEKDPPLAQTIAFRGGEYVIPTLYRKVLQYDNYIEYKLDGNPLLKAKRTLPEINYRFNGKGRYMCSSRKYLDKNKVEWFEIEIMSLGAYSTGNTFVVKGKNIVDYQYKEIRVGKNKPEFHFIVRSREVDEHGKESFYLNHLVLNENYEVIEKSDFPIEKNVSVYYLVPEGNEIVLYYYGQCVEGRDAIVRLEYDKNDDCWNEYDIEVPKEDRVARLPCYTTEIIVKEVETGYPAANIDVILYAEDRVFLDTPIGLREVDLDKKLTLQTDAQGKIYFTQYVNSLFAVKVFAEIPGLTQDGQVIGINQHEQAEIKMRKASKDDYYNAVKTDPFGTEDVNMIPDKYRTRENAEAIYDSINEIFKNKALPNSVHGCVGAYLYDKNSLSEDGFSADNDSHWSLELVDNRLVFKQLSRDEAQAEMLRMLNNGSFEVPNFLKKIGNFFRAVGRGVVKVVKTVVSAAETVISFIYNGILAVIKFVIEKVCHVLNMIGEIFGKIFVFFFDLFLWLILDIRWADVLRTKRALSMIAEKMLANELPIFIDDKSKVVIDKISEVQEQITDWLEQAKASMKEKSLLDVTKYESRQEVAEIQNNNIMLRNLESAVTGNLNIDLELKIIPEMNDIIDQIMEIIKQVGDNIEKGPGYQALKEFFEEKLSSLPAFFSINVTDIINLMFGIVQLAVDAVSALIIGLVKLIAAFFKMILEQLQTKLEIPFFTVFYKTITKDDSFTWLDLPLLIVAFLATCTYKILGYGIMFKNDAEIDNFVKSVTILNNSDSIGIEWRRALIIITMSFGGMSLFSTLLSDISYTPGTSFLKKWKEYGGIVSGACGIIAWCIALALSCKSSEKITDREITFFTASGLAMLIGTVGTIFDVFDKKIAKRFCHGIVTLCGDVHFMGAVLWSLEDKVKLHDFVPEVFYSMREILDVSMVTKFELDPNVRTTLVITDGLAIAAVLSCGISAAVKIKDEKSLS